MSLPTLDTISIYLPNIILGLIIFILLSDVSRKSIPVISAPKAPDNNSTFTKTHLS